MKVSEKDPQSRKRSFPQSLGKLINSKRSKGGHPEDSENLRTCEKTSKVSEYFFSIIFLFTTVSRVVPKKLKVAIYAAKTLSFCWKFREAVQVWKKILKKSCIRPKNSKGTPCSPPYVWIKKNWFMRDSNPHTVTKKPNRGNFGHSLTFAKHENILCQAQDSNSRTHAFQAMSTGKEACNNL